MTDGLISFTDLTKRFGRGAAAVTAVDGLTTEVRPGRVTGFLGPNGAGKTTSLRCLLGLVQPTHGTALFGGTRYEDLADPVRTVGACLEATAFYPGRRARDHVRVIADAAGIPAARADAVLEQVGLSGAEDRRVGDYSLGMRQRLTLAVALLGDPQYLILDEPANGLDPQGIAWLRGFLRYLAAQGRTVLVSSHVLAEVQQTADDVVILSRGRLIVAEALAELERSRATLTVHVVTPTPDRLLAALRADLPGAEVEGDSGVLQVRGATAAQVGSTAFRANVELHGLTQHSPDLEQLFLELTAPPPVPGTGIGASA